MTVPELQALLGPALRLAQLGAAFTQTSKDDTAVRVLQLIVGNNEILGGILELFEKEGTSLPDPLAS
jgi:hypothetical protein